MQPNRDGLGGAGEWHQLKPLIPSLQGKTVLDLGCGYSRHCAFAAEQGAAKISGLDLSRKMIEEAQKRNGVISNLALHYIENIARGAKYAIFRM